MRNQQQLLENERVVRPVAIGLALPQIASQVASVCFRIEYGDGVVTASGQGAAQ
jgi:hypothetical protein